MPQISVIVPVYKAEAYLHDCIDSILSQTFSDFEAILVDDGSPDRCGQICEEYAKCDGRIRVIHQENQGQSAARNHALSIAEGVWVCYVDSDDAIHPRMLELLYNAAVSGGAGISMCRMLESPQMPENFHDPREGGFEILTMDEETLLALFDAGEYPAWVACAKLIRRELAEGYPFTEGRVYEDNEAVCRWVCRAGKLARIREELYYYRTNPISTTQQAYSLKKLDYRWALESIIRFYHSLGYDALTERFCELYVQETAGQYFRIRKEMNRPDVLKQIRQSVIRLTRKDGIPLTKRQKEILLDAMHPKLIRIYWPLEGAIRTLREKGVSGVVRKIRAQLGKGDSQ